MQFLNTDRGLVSSGLLIMLEGVKPLKSRKERKSILSHLKNNNRFYRLRNDKQWYFAAILFRDIEPTMDSTTGNQGHKYPSVSVGSNFLVASQDS